jgi:colicin import membrane protein
MKGMHGRSGIGDPNGQRWTRGVVVSLLFHILLFSLVLFVPESMPTRRIGGSPIYEVNLVEMPSPILSAASRAPAEKPGREVSSPKEAPAARRIAPPAQEEKPVVIGKRVVERKKEEKKEPVKAPKPTVSPSKLIDGAISKIEKKVKAEKTDHLAQAISRIETRAQGTDAKVSGGGGAETGITIRMYQLAVEEQIKSNWSYPVALIDPKKRKDLEAIVLVKVRQDGTIVKSWFKKRSASAIFDGSVLKAVERSDPLPPFPEGYTKTSDEIEIRFDLSDLEEF